MRTQKRCIGYVAIVVDDDDRAIEYYTETLGFTLVEDTPQPGKRWVVVTPNPESDCNLLLARASNERQEDFIGNQCGGRVFLFLQTDDFWRDYNSMKEKVSTSARSHERRITGWSWCLRISTATAGICIRTRSPDNFEAAQVRCVAELLW